jgi:HK97 family phage major capsid protein
MRTKWVNENASVENVRGLVLEYITQRGGAIKPLAAPDVDLTQKEQENYSVRKAIWAQLNNDWKEAGFEREISSELAKKRKHTFQGSNAFLMPTNLRFQAKDAQRSVLFEGMNKRAIYQVGTAGQGGNLVETELLASSFIEVLRNRTVTGQLGAQYLTGLVDNVNIPRQNAQTTTYWVGESVALTESEATFDQVQLRPHVVGAYSKMSRLMLQQSTPAIEQIVRNDLLMVEALAIDAAALYGTGSSSQPTGISNTSNIGSVVGGTNGANWTFDFMVQLYAAPLVANAPQENLAFAINAKTKGYLATLKSTTGQYLWNPTQSIAGGIPPDLVGYRYAVSNQLPWTLTKGTATSICSMAIFGNWQELLIGEWGVTEIMVNPYDSTGFTTGDVGIRVFQTVDIGLRHPASFAVMSDGLTPGF